MNALNNSDKTDMLASTWWPDEILEIKGQRSRSHRGGSGMWRRRHSCQRWVVEANFFSFLVMCDVIIISCVTSRSYMCLKEWCPLSRVNQKS